MKKEIYPCLWFDGKAKEAAEYYCSVFMNSRITSEDPLVVMFEIEGKKFMGLNGGPMYTITEGVSFVIECDTQDEIDYYWEKLTDGGEESMCGWLKDRFGVSWQIVPADIAAMIRDPERGERAMQALLQMRKIDLEKLRKA